jgi:hypothetical protein
MHDASMLKKATEKEANLTSIVGARSNTMQSGCIALIKATHSEMLRGPKLTPLFCGHFDFPKGSWRPPGSEQAHQVFKLNFYVR